MLDYSANLALLEIEMICHYQYIFERFMFSVFFCRLVGDFRFVVLEHNKAASKYVNYVTITLSHVNGG